MDVWDHGSPYDRYIGRWSRGVAPLFLAWLDRPAGGRWLDVGCGTGALSAAIGDRCAPCSLTAVEPSPGFRALAVAQLGAAAQVLAGSAESLPLADATCDVVVSGLVLNFIADLPAALAEMRRVCAPGATVAGYVWDYGDGMEVIRRFWDAAVALDPDAAPLHEAARFPLCRPAALLQAFEQAGLSAVATTALDLVADFDGFDAYWQPFLGGQGPAPAYAVALADDRRAALQARLRSQLAPHGGAFSLRARAFGVRGVDGRGAVPLN